MRRHIARGRGARLQPDPRYGAERREAFDDGWTAQDPAPPRVPTTVVDEHPRTVLSRNDSPDIPFAQSVNPYRGCEHGCSYCYARPAHAFMDLSPGLDFETRLFAKPGAAERLREALARPGYRCEPITLGANTDPYQPVERERRITRAIVALLVECRHPFSIVTKSALVERDLDLLTQAARHRLCTVHLSVTTLDRRLARAMEPRAAAPERRLRAIERLAAAGVPVGVLFAPVIPALNEHELETVLAAARQAGAGFAGYVLLRLPGEVAEVFTDWLRAHRPQQADRVLAALQEMRGGRLDDPAFGSRLRGRGARARLLADRFALTCRRLGLQRRPPPLAVDAFRPPAHPSGQLALW